MTKTRSILSQRYSGDITIFPEISYSQFPNVLTNPSTEFMIQATLHGERATWPKLSRIQNHCAIELALDDAVQQLRAHIVFSPSQVNLRLNTLRTGSRTNMETARLDTGGPTREIKTRRSLSSSDSDGSGPSSSPTRKDGSSPQGCSSVRKKSPSVQLSLQTSEVGLGSETDAQTTMKSWTMNTTDNSDESDDEISDPSVTEAMVSSLPALAPSTRHLFPHASQPATPASKLGQSYFTGPSSSLATTSSASPNSLFQGSAGMVSSNGVPADPQNQSSGQRKRHKPTSGPPTPAAMEVNNSSTREMVRRKKRSLSTGITDLMPPSLAR